MKRFLLLFITILSAGHAMFAQNRYVVFFTDKNNSPYSIANPSAYLSQRALSRRAAQNISVTPQDFPVNPAYVSGVAATGAIILNTSRWFNSATIMANNGSILTAVSGLPFVSNVLNVGRVMGTGIKENKFERERMLTPGSFYTVPQRNQVFNYGQSFNQVQMLKGDLMHQNGYTGEGVLIAVLDAGFLNADNMPVFDSLRANNRIVGTWDFVSNEANVYDDDSHGTMVLSTMGGNTPGEIIGTAPNASYLLLRSEDAPNEYIIEEYNWASAAEYADSAGADVINSSLGYTTFDDPSQNHSYSDLDGLTTPITRAADIAASKGIVVCNSAGNEGNSNWFHIGAPADARNILTVGAVDSSAAYASFSSKGPSFDGRVKPDVAAQGAQTIVANPWTGLGVFPGNGTSFSSPLMAGMVATLLQCHPGATTLQIIEAIRQSSSHYTTPDSLTGYGIPDFPMACMLLSGLNPNNFSNGDLISIMGNPFTDALTFEFYTTSPQDITIRVYDLLGRPVSREVHSVQGFANNRIEIPLSVSKGVYILEVITESKIISQRVVKQ